MKVTTSQRRSGEQGEQTAAEYLLSKGYEIVERNYCYKGLEIDLIVSNGDCLVFVEVKTRAASQFGFPEMFVRTHKRKAILRCAGHYIEEKNWQGNISFDIVAVMMKEGIVAEVLDSQLEILIAVQ